MNLIRKRKSFQNLARDIISIEHILLRKKKNLLHRLVAMKYHINRQLIRISQTRGEPAQTGLDRS